MPTTMTLSPEDATALLRVAGMRVTRQRVATLQSLAGNQHSTVDEIVTSLEGDLPKVSFQAIYLVVADLVGAGLINRLDLPGHPSRYELNRRDNHHHVLCTSCGRVEDVACAVGEAPCLHPSETHDMEIAIADVLYRGTCRECREQATPTP